ncbi:MAG: hypothetical protein PHD15_01190 [Clostridia bacterium]|nr:hypothetical protein [Clostridia bacterium]MDD4386364.1 hypothetical protein [Clostridia bacterium]
MLDKMRTGLNIFILCMFVVAIVYGIITIIYNAFNADSINNVNIISTENIDTYITEKNLVITDYSTFFVLEGCVQKLITSLHENKTSEVYDVLIGDFKTQIDNDKTKLIKYYNNNFKYETVEDMDVIGYQNFNNLKQVYKIDEYNYICIVTSINESKLAKIGIKLISSDKYIVSYLEI